MFVADGIDAPREISSMPGVVQHTLDSLKSALRTALQPECAERVRAAAARMTKPADSVARTADLLEKAAQAC